jgi:hypothetical protein
MGIIKRIEQGVKTTFGIKDLTPQEKVAKQEAIIKQQQEIIKRKKEEQSYKEIISQRQKEAWQVAYQQELARQRSLYAEQQEKDTQARAMSKARQDVWQQNQPQQNRFVSALASGMKSVGKFQQGVANIFPAPPQSVQQDLAKSIRGEPTMPVQNYKTGKSMKPLMPSTPNFNFNMDGTPMTSKPKSNSKLKKKLQSSAVDELIWKL